MTGDMKKKLKNCFFKKCQFLHFLLKLKVKNCFLKKQLFSILIISLVIFDLQKRTIPQIKALKILFWPYFIHFTARMDIWWAMKLRKCPVFFPQTLEWLCLIVADSQTIWIQGCFGISQVSLNQRTQLWNCIKLHPILLSKSADMVRPCIQFPTVAFIWSCTGFFLNYIFTTFSNKFRNK